jgi:hypothetical protein
MNLGADPPTTDEKSIVDIGLETLTVWYDKANDMAKGFISGAGSLVFMWYDPSLPKMHHIAVTTASAVTATFVVYPKQSVTAGTTLLAAVAMTVQSGLEITAAHIDPRAVVSASMPYVQSGGKYMVSNIAGPGMKYIFEHKMSSIGFSLGIMLTERSYTFLYLYLPKHGDRFEPIVENAADTLVSFTNTTKHVNEIAEELSSAVKDSITEAKQRFGSYATGSIVIGIAGLAVTAFFSYSDKPQVKKRRLK